MTIGRLARYLPPQNSSELNDAKGESIPKEQIRDQFIKRLGQSSRKAIIEQALQCMLRYPFRDYHVLRFS